MLVELPIDYLLIRVWIRKIIRLTSLNDRDDWEYIPPANGFSCVWAGGRISEF